VSGYKCSKCSCSFSECINFGSGDGEDECGTIRDEASERRSPLPTRDLGGKKLRCAATGGCGNRTLIPIVITTCSCNNVLMTLDNDHNDSLLRAIIPF
jgi:hypothetical protein